MCVCCINGFVRAYFSKGAFQVEDSSYAESGEIPGSQNFMMERKLKDGGRG